MLGVSPTEKAIAFYVHICIPVLCLLLAEPWLYFSSRQILANKAAIFLKHMNSLKKYVVRDTC